MTGQLVYMAAQARHAEARLTHRRSAPPRKSRSEARSISFERVRFYLHRRAYAAS